MGNVGDRHKSVLSRIGLAVRLGNRIECSVIGDPWKRIACISGRANLDFQMVQAICLNYADLWVIFIDVRIK